MEMIGKLFSETTSLLKCTLLGKLIFMAPAKPLVQQQAAAIMDIIGVPRSDCSLMVGTSSTVAGRVNEWSQKRIFFATPQIIRNDIENGLSN
jgi:ATP-dependent DNA helicase MPH1